MILCFGTRPEWLKIKPLLNEYDHFKLFFTGQHEDLIKIDLSEDKLIRAKVKDYSGSRLNDLISSILIEFEKLKNENAILIQGDTASAFACALAAFNTNKKIFYLEAGLRSFDLENPYPEEGYRQMISRISSVNICPTELSKKNLVEEKVLGENIVVGNTILDNLLQQKDKSKYEDHVLITLHRRENQKIITDWNQSINTIAISNPSLKFIYFKHPSQDYKHKIFSAENIKLINPHNHNDFLKILVKSKFLITDSGGLQEEASFLNKKVIVCRKNTERPEGIKTGHIILCKKPKFLEEIVNDIKINYFISNQCPYGDGNSSKRIIDILKKENVI
tara:strand:- start:282 stop:1283 length:1002 start_codon:yes stop_codon:yes gene_type:complete